MNRDRREDLLGPRMWVLQTTPGKEVSGAPFYRPTPGPPHRTAPYAVRPGGRLAVRRRADGRRPRTRPARGAGDLARSRLDARPDALGVPRPSHQPRRLLSPRRGPRPG